MIYNCMENDEYKDCIQKDGKHYRYDPDYDCFYRIFTRDEYADLPHWEKYNWLYVTAILCAICYYVQFIH